LVGGGAFWLPGQLPKARKVARLTRNSWPNALDEKPGHQCKEMPLLPMIDLNLSKENVLPCDLWVVAIQGLETDA